MGVSIGALMRSKGPRIPVRCTTALLIALVVVVGSLTVAQGSGGSLHRDLSRGPLTLAGPSLSPVPTPWPTYMDNVERTGANLLEHTLAPSNVSGLEQIWSISDNGSDFSAPIVANGSLYYGSWNGNESAVDAANGAVEWRRYLGTDPACGGGYTPMGIASTPAYLNGTLYLGGGDGYWYALNATTGATDWRFLAGSGAAGYYNWASALVYQNSLYVGLSSCFDSPLVPAGLLELNLTGPHTVSHFFNTTPPANTGESIWTTPALDPGSGTLWITTGNENPPGYPIYANALIGLKATTLNVSGSWQVPNVAGQDSDFGSTPTLFETASGIPMVVATDKNGVAYALNRSNVSANGSWSPAWNLTTGGGFSGGAFDGNTLYLAGGSTVYAVDPSNGSVLWSTGMDGGGTIYGSLAWANGLVFAGGGNEVEAIDAANGTVLWNATLPGGTQTVTEPVVADGRLYVASGDYGTQGYLTAFGLSPSALYPVTLHETGLPAGTNWSAELGGVTLNATVANLTFSEPNGSFPYAAAPTGHYAPTVNGSGIVTVRAGAVVVNLSYGYAYTATFELSGLPAGGTWSVAVGNTSGYNRSESSQTSALVFYVQNGTYGYRVTPPTGYSVTPSNGSLTVAGSSVETNLTLARMGSSEPVWEWVVVGVTGAVLVALVAIALARRRRSRRPPVGGSPAAKAAGPGTVSEVPPPG